MLHKRELPDIISITDASMIRQFIDSGKVWRLDEFLEQYCADSHLLTDFPEDMKQKQIREYGGRYAFVNTIFRSGYAYMEHLANLLHQVFKYASEYDIIDKDYSKFIRITKAEDDEAGIPFTREEIQTLWQNADRVPYADTVLILIYTGWRISELLSMHTENVSLSAWTMTGGVKTAAGKNRIVPIHSGIRHLVQHYHKPGKPFFISNPNNGRAMTKTAYYRLFDNVLTECRITTKHTPHDCRHTFTSLLDSAGANEVCIDRLVGHASKSLTKRTYTHKDMEELRAAVELIKIEPLE